MPLFPSIGLGGILTFDVSDVLPKFDSVQKRFADLGQTANNQTFEMGKNLLSLSKKSFNFLGIQQAVGDNLVKERGYAQLRADANLTQAQIEDLSKTTEKFAISSEESTNAIIGSYAQMAKQGFRSTEDMKGALGGILAFADATGTGLSESTSMLIKVTRGAGMAVTETQKMADALAGVSNVTGASMSSLAESLSISGSRLKQFGMSAQEQIAIMGALASGNVRGQVATMGLQDAYRRLLRPQTKANGLLAQWGISMTSSTGEMAPFSRIVEQVKERVDKLPNAYQKNMAIQQIFGMRGMRVYNALSKNLGVYKSAIDAASNSEGAAKEKADIRTGDTLTMWAMVRKNIREGAMMFFQSLTGPGSFLEGLVRNIRDKSVELLERFRQFKETDVGKQFMKIASVAVIALGAIAPLFIGLKGIGMIMRTVIPMAAGSMASTFSKLGGIVRMAFGPLGIVIGIAIAALTAMRKEGESLGDTFFRVFGDIIGLVGGFVRGFLSYFSSIWEGIKRVANSIFEVFDALFGWLRSDTKGTGSEMKSVFYDLGTFIGKVVVNSLEFIGWLFRGLGDWIRESRVSMQDWMTNVSSNWSRLKRNLGMISEEEYARNQRKVAWIREANDAERKAEEDRQRGREDELNRKNRELETERMKNMEEYNAPAKPKIDVNVNVKDQRKLTLENNTYMDGKQVASSLQNINLEIQDRAGFKTNWWQRRMATEYASVPDVSGF